MITMTVAADPSAGRAPSNIDEVLALLARLGDPIDFNRDGLADEVFDRSARAIRDRFQAETGSEGQFDANRGAYGEAKREKSIPIGVGLVNGGEMGREAQFLGRREIQPDEAVLTFGADETNQKKGQWFHGGAEGYDGCEPSGAEGQPPRPFFALTEPDIDDAMDVVSRAVGRWLEGL